MLEKQHIEWYWENIMQARRTALQDILTARMFAKETSCTGCEYCQYLLRHEEVLGRTTSGLILLVDSLQEGARGEYIFPQVLERGAMIYQGFIADDGEYLPVRGGDHNVYREEYMARCGKERAYRMISVCGQDQKAQVLFRDRKDEPSKKQYATLRELMIDAKGALKFFFVYDPTHPH